MPIRAENKGRYPADWKSISKRMREQAGQKCQKCGAPNGEVICRGTDDAFNGGTYMIPDGRVYDDETGEHLGIARGSEYPGRYARIVLTVAHLDHQPENCGDDNLRAWCQRCHNLYDAPMRAAGIKGRKWQKNAMSDLFDSTTAAP